MNATRYQVHRRSPSPLSLALVVMLAVVALAAPARAAEYWVDPTVSGSGDGSEGNPWSSLEEAIDGAADGDTIWLRTGDYGRLNISGSDHATPVLIAADADHKPRFSSVDVSSSSGWTLRGLEVSGQTDVLVDVNGEALVVEDCFIFTAEDTGAWTAEDWVAASDGVRVRGTDVTIRGNYVLNVSFGITVEATHSLIEGNVVENFAGDGLRGLGDYTTFQYNVVKNSYSVDGNHADGFQSWSVGSGGVGTGEVVGIVLRGNTILNFEDPNQPFPSELQGIGCFDGTYVGWVVENNVVITNHWHGITFHGARDLVIANNTVIDLNAESPGPPWIQVNDATNCVVRNNLTTSLENAESVLEEGNIVLDMDELSTYFVDPMAHDLRLLEDAPAIDQGVLEGAPGLDQDQIPRPQGDGVDVGAFEWHEASVAPVAGSAADGGTSADGGSSGRAGASGAAGTGGSGAAARGGHAPEPVAPARAAPTALARRVKAAALELESAAPSRSPVRLRIDATRRQRAMPRPVARTRRARGTRTAADAALPAPAQDRVPRRAC